MKSPTKRIFLVSRFAEWLYPSVIVVGGYIVPIASGYLLGRFVNASSATSTTNFKQAMTEMFSVSRPINWTSWLSVIIIILLPGLKKTLYYIKTVAIPEHWLAELSDTRTESIIRPFSKSVISWGYEATLQLVPDIQRGWPLDEIEVICDGGYFDIPDSLQSEYDCFFKNKFDVLHLDQDGDKYALIKSPAAFSDASRLKLELVKTKYSVVKFYEHILSKDTAQSEQFIRETLERSNIPFPNAFCMHGIVITRDNMILATKRSPKVSYYPGVWSVSAEEQLSTDDFTLGNNEVVKSWGKRFMFEELGLESSHYNIKNLRALSVFLEADILNCSLAAILKIGISASELNSILKAKIRNDYEFVDWKFYSFSELPGILLANQGAQKHPSTDYRIILALANKYGASRLAEFLRKLLLESS